MFRIQVWGGYPSANQQETPNNDLHKGHVDGGFMLVLGESVCGFGVWSRASC